MLSHMPKLHTSEKIKMKTPLRITLGGIWNPKQACRSTHGKGLETFGRDWRTEEKGCVHNILEKLVLGIYLISLQ